MYKQGCDYSAQYHYVGNHFEDFKENDMVLLGPNLPHCWKNSPNQKTSANAIVIHWNHDLIDEKWLEREEFVSIKKLLQYALNGVKFSVTEATRFKNQLKKLTTLDSFEKFHYFLKILRELSLCDDMTQLTSQSDMHMLNYNNNERIGLALEYIRKNFSQKISLADVADSNKMTEEAFSRFFSKVMRKSFFVT